MGLKDSLRSYKQDPFSFFDNLSLVVHGNNLNFFQKYKRAQQTALWMAVVCGVFWLLLGFDSTPLQMIHVLIEGIPGLLLGQKGWGDLITIYNSFYGKEMHYSAFVIYLLMFYGLSKNWEARGIVKSKNMAYSFSFMFLAVGLFEWFWISSFGIFQNQPWVYTWMMPQLRILLQNSAFTFVGILGVVYIWADSYVLDKNKQVIGRNWHFNLGWLSWVLIGLSIGSALLWIFYPGPIQQISVQLANGQIWHSSRLFPQTLYTIKIDPASPVNAGDWCWVEDNWIHGLNTLVKVIWALTLYWIGKVKSVYAPQKL